jgi:hypothetical protein
MKPPSKGDLVAVLAPIWREEWAHGLVIDERPPSHVSGDTFLRVMFMPSGHTLWFWASDLKRVA